MQRRSSPRLVRPYRAWRTTAITIVLLVLLTLRDVVAAQAPVGPAAQPGSDQQTREQVEQSKPYLRAKHFHDQRAYPFAEIPSNALLRARRQLAEGVRNGTIPVAPQGQSAGATAG